MRRRILSILLTLCMIMTGVPATVFATEASVTEPEIETTTETEAETETKTETVTVECEGVGGVDNVVPQSMMLFGLRDSKTWDGDTNTYYGQLDEDSKKIYDTLKTAYASGASTEPVALNFNKVVSVVGGAELTTDDEAAMNAELKDMIQYALLALIYDEPEMSWLVNVRYGFSYNCSAETDGSSYTWTAKDVKFTLQSGDNSVYTAASLSNAVTTAKNSIDGTLSQGGDTTAFAKAKVIHDYICENVTYADDDLTQNKYQTAHSALVEGTTVCAGYAKAFKVLCDGYGIPCILVSGVGVNSKGDSENHMWNYVQLDGNWYAVDCTWDDQASIYYDYFLAGSDTLATNFGNSAFSASHISSGQWDGAIDEHFVYPELSTSVYSPSEAELLDTVYVSGSRLNASASVTGTGTVADPYNDMETALQRVQSGGKIQIIGSLTSPQLSGDAPLNITKPVTIIGGEFRCNYGGVVLGADVKFENVVLSFINPVRNAIIANGHTLTLKNVEQSGTYEVDLFCGAITQAQNRSPEAGDHGEIILSGSNKLGDIYAGNFSDLGKDENGSVPTEKSHFSGNATITVQSDATGTLGGVYAYGARENRQGGAYNDMWTGNNVEENFTVDGDVTINLYGSLVKNVYGASDQKAHVTFDADANQSHTNTIKFENIGLLEVVGNTLEPAALNEGVDVKINEGAELELSTVIQDSNNAEDDSAFKVGDFVGGGMLVMDSKDKLKITGNVSGTTVFQTDDANRPNDKFTSGTVEYEWPYIDVSNAAGTGTFTFNPYEMQKGTTLELLNGAWTTSAAPDLSDEGLTSFALASGAANSRTITETNINANGFSIPVEYVATEKIWGLYDIPLTISMIKDGEQTLYHAEEVEDESGVYYRVETLGIAEIYAANDEIDEDGNGSASIVFYPDPTDPQIAPGTYEISITVPLVGQAEPTTTVNYTLTVTDDADDTPAAVLSPALPNGENGWYQTASLGAPTGYGISLTENASASLEVTIPDGRHTNGIIYWLKPDGDSETMVKKTYPGPVKVDGTVPSITKAEVGSSSITNSSATVQAQATDATSGVPDTAEGYQLTYVSGGDKAPTIAAFKAGNEGGSFEISGMKPNTEYHFTLTVMDQAGNSSTSDVTVTTKKIDISAGKVSLKDGVSYTYDGTAKEPELEDLILTLGDDSIALDEAGFALSYADNTAAGNGAKVTITAKDENATYKGSAAGTFSIAKLQLTEAMFALSDGNGATITGDTYIYDGTAKTPSVEVKDGNVTLSEGTDYTVSYENNINAGQNATVIIEGTGSCTGKISKTFTINKADAAISGTDHYAKTFGGEAFALDAAVSKGTGELQYDVTAGDDVISVSDSGLVTIKNAGSATITVSLPASDNYKAVTKDITITIGKAIGITSGTINKGYLHAKQNVASIDLKEALPADCGSPVTFKNLTVGDGAIEFDSAPAVTNGKLEFTTKAGNVGDKKTITVVAETRNYEDITITVNLELLDKKPVALQSGSAVKVTNEITYGDPVSKLKFADAVFVDEEGTVVAGTLAWETPDDKPDAGDAALSWVFTPAASDEYAVVKGTVSTKVKKADPEIITKPTVSDRTYHAATAFADSDLTGGTVNDVNGGSLAGSWSWKTAGIIPTVGNGGYIAVFSPVDTNNYHTAETRISVKVTPAEVIVTPAAGQSKTYGADDPTFAYTTSGFTGSETLSGKLGRKSGEDVGTYAYTLGSLSVVPESEKGNYTLKLDDSAPAFSITQAERTAPTAKLTFTLNADGETFTATATKLEGALYSVDGINWSETNTIANCLPNTEYTIYVKYAETKNYKESPEAEVKATTPKPQIRKPVIDPNGGTFEAEQKVEIACDISNTIIYYTDDSSDPATSATRKEYTDAFTIRENTAIRAIAVRPDGSMTDSNEAAAVFLKAGDEDLVMDRIETEAITEVPDGLKGKYETPQQIVEELQRILTTDGDYTKENTVTYDVKLQFSLDGGKTWIDATTENFPGEGITVTLPYPEGTAKDSHDFIVTHMFTTDMRGFKAGQTEQPPVIKTDRGIQVTLNGLSPVGVAWKSIAKNGSPAMGDDSNMLLWAGLMAVALMGAAICIFARRKKKASCK